MYKKKWTNLHSQWIILIHLAETDRSSKLVKMWELREVVANMVNCSNPSNAFPLLIPLK